jgi:hypothetical protein
MGPVRPHQTTHGELERERGVCCPRDWYSLQSILPAAGTDFRCFCWSGVESTSSSQVNLTRLWVLCVNLVCRLVKDSRVCSRLCDTHCIPFACLSLIESLIGSRLTESYCAVFCFFLVAHQIWHLLSDQYWSLLARTVSFMGSLASK